MEYDMNMIPQDDGGGPVVGLLFAALALILMLLI
jgi:hypothetical protein